MDIFITMDNFPTKFLGNFKADLKSHGIKADVQEKPNGSVLFSCTVESVVKGQIAVILADKYRFAKEGEDIGEEEETQLCIP